jgi:Do/DeqQ family serine protease
MFRRLAYSLLLIVAGLVAGLVLTGRMRSADETAAAPAAPPVAEQPPVRTSGPPAGVPDFADVASRAVAGVANVSSLQVVRRPTSPFANDPFFRYFFGDGGFPEEDRRSYSLGSGVIISPDGYVVTNNHVVGDHVREITAVLPDKREVSGKLVGTDPMTDIALLKLEAGGNLPVVPWGDSSRLRVGQWVLAIGSPFQLNQTVTLGIVSAVGRANVGVADYEDFIQTDAAINPGNSGGALVDAQGNLVGINTAILSESGGYQGVGFAVPSNLARRVIDDLLRYGEVRRGSIGAMQVVPLTPQLAEQLGIQEERGVIIWQVGSRAAQEGFQRWDVVTALNGQKIDNTSQFLRLVADARIGSTATVGVIRRGRQIAIKVPITQGGRTR